MKSSNTRNYGIDLLRITSMLYIVILHVLGHGGILSNVKAGSLHFHAAWLLESWCFCAVNIFALISGYVGYSEKERPHNYANYFVMWLQVTRTPEF